MWQLVNSMSRASTEVKRRNVRHPKCNKTKFCQRREVLPSRPAAGLSHERRETSSGGSKVNEHQN